MLTKVTTFTIVLKQEMKGCLSFQSPVFCLQPSTPSASLHGLYHFKVTSPTLASVIFTKATRCHQFAQLLYLLTIYWPAGRSVGAPLNHNYGNGND